MKYDHQQIIDSKNKDIFRLLQIIDEQKRQLDVLEQLLQKIDEQEQQLGIMEQAFLEEWTTVNQRRSPQHVVCRTHTSVS